MVYFDWFYWIAGFGFIATILIVTVSVVCWCWTDPDLERIAEARGDYQVGGGNHD